MFRKIGDGLRRFMAGRYGSDRLNQCLLGAAFVLLLISAIGGRQGRGGGLPGAGGCSGCPC